MSLDGKPHQARTQPNCEAWFYMASPTWISIYIREGRNGRSRRCEITRRQLRKWIDKAIQDRGRKNA